VTDQITAVLSMLHEPAERNSATRTFRQQPVLSWTLERLSRSKRVTSVAILCWEDQLDAVVPVAEAGRADVLAKGPRAVMAEIDAVTASRRWADGWRGGLLGTCEFDRGFHAGWTVEVAQRLGADVVVLADPSAGLIDPALVDDLIAHAIDRPQVELCFMPAAPGLSGTLLRMPLIKRLALAKTHPGRLLHYTPDTLSREVLGGESCAPVPASIARTTDRFTLDTDRQITRLAAATFALNGQLIYSRAEDLVTRLRDQAGAADTVPREVVLELNTARATRPIYWPGRYQTVERPDMTFDRAAHVIDQLGERADDVRLTIAGLGDPLLAETLLPVIGYARSRGLAVHVETDLVSGDIAGLAQSWADVVSIHVPALTPATYAAVMGVDAYATVLENVRTFGAARAARVSGGVPILAPTFTKCRDNLGEMETWYDQWLHAVGAAVIAGPSDHAGQLPVVAVADMAPPKRRPCARLVSRMVVRSEGNVVSCEQDFSGRTVFGNVDAVSITEIWQHRLAGFRADHREGNHARHALCGACKEWDRP
jgi:radical SAM protein with 4Fe4S-binding SPASM domain